MGCKFENEAGELGTYKIQKYKSNLNNKDTQLEENYSYNTCICIYDKKHNKVYHCSSVSMAVFPSNFDRNFGVI